MKKIDTNVLERRFFEKGNPVKKLLRISLELFNARNVSVYYGTDATFARSLPVSQWDRGVLDRFDMKGPGSALHRSLGRLFLKKSMKPVRFYQEGRDGSRLKTDGMIAHVMRNCNRWYGKGVRVVICPDSTRIISEETFQKIPYHLYDGNEIHPVRCDVRFDTQVVNRFRSANSIYACLQDYGVLVINTVDPDLVAMEKNHFIREDALRSRLDILIRLLEISSLVFLRKVGGSNKGMLLWHKERELRTKSWQRYERERQYRDLYENAPIAYVSLDRDGRINRYNRKMSMLTGYGPTALNGTFIFDLLTNRAVNMKRIARINQCLAEGKAMKNVDFEIARADGEGFWVSVSVEGIRNVKNRVLGFRMILVDISERRHMEQGLLELQKKEALGTLASGVAHDFNNILSPISGYAEILLMDLPENTVEKKYYQVILDCVGRAKDLISQILILGRMKKHERSVVDAAEMVKNALQLVQISAAPSIRLETEIDQKSGGISVDPARFNQVILHLAGNACQAMAAAGGCLKISLKKESRADGKPVVCLSVKDTGTGIAPEMMDRIFEPYFSTRKEQPGAGMGLSVARGIVESYGGYIEVESTPGEGSCFLVYLPSFDAQILECRGASLEKEIRRGRGRILLYSGEKKEALARMRQMETFGYKVTCFTGLANALKVLSKNQDLFDMIVADAGLPVPENRGLAEQFQRAGPGIPMVLAGNSAAGLRRDIRGASGPVTILDQLPAPVPFSHLLGRLLSDHRSGAKPAAEFQQQTG